MTGEETGFPPSVAGDHATRVRLRWEIALVLALSVGQSALYSVLSLVRASLRTTPVGQQQTQLNPARDAEAAWDALYRFLNIAFSLAIVAFVVYLLWEPGRNALHRLGLDLRRFGSAVGRRSEERRFGKGWGRKVRT